MFKKLTIENDDRNASLSKIENVPPDIKNRHNSKNHTSIDESDVCRKMANLKIDDVEHSSGNIKLVSIDLSHINQSLDNFYDQTVIPTSYKIVPLPNVANKNEKNQVLIKAKIHDEERVCLLDTGAEISVLGKGAETIWEKIKDTPIFRKINVKTAGGEIHPGIIKKVNVEYDKEKRIIQFVYAPTIAIPIALGMNFCNLWKVFLIRMKSNEHNCIEKEQNFDLCELDITEDDSSYLEEEEKEYDLNSKEKDEVERAMKLFNYSDGDKLGCQRIMQHKIDTGNNPAIFCMPYRYNPSVTDKIKAIIDRWLSLNVIEPSKSEWRLPIVVVNKPDGSLRLCLDARKLNAITKRDCHTPPNVLHKIDCLPNKAKFYIRLDLNEAFLQTELEKEDRKKTAFSIPGIGEYQFVRMPFGLVNSPATQSRLMEKIFEKEDMSYIMHYLDDVIIMGISIHHLVENIKRVANLLNSHNLTVSRKKTSTVLKRIRILGHIIDENGIHTDPRKIKAIINWPKPQTGKELERFLGFINWYRRFIQNYAVLVGPLYEISKKKILASWWDDKRNECFEKIKKCMTSAPVLRTPNWLKPMIIYADASDKGIGAVLCQKDEEGNEYVIEFYSYKLMERERKYAPTEKEMLAVLKAVRHFKYYIEFNELIIYSDHHALQYILNMKLMSSRLARWILELQPFVNKIIHRAGKDMVVPDALSRADYSFLSSINLQKISVTWYEEFLKELVENPDNYPQYVVKESKIFKKMPWKRNVFDDDYRQLPHPDLIEKIIDSAHDKTQHGGWKATAYEIKCWFWWPNINDDVKEFVSQCRKCAGVKMPNYILTPPLGNFRIPKDTMECLSIDIKGPLPMAGPHKFRNIITCIDLLSRYAWGKRISSVTSDKIIIFLKDIFREQQKIPKCIFHDNGSVFKSKEFQQFLQSENIISKPTATYHPQANSVERFNKSLTEAIRIELSNDPYKQIRWSSALSGIMEKLNARVNSVTQFSPYEILYGRRPGLFKGTLCRPLNDEQHQEIKKIAFKRSIMRYLQNKKQFDKRSFSREFSPGEIVMIRIFHLSNAEKRISQKLFPPWEVGKILKKIDGNSYAVMKLDNNITKINLKHIKGISKGLQEQMQDLFEN